jgi:hypothetical protein
MMLDTYSLPSWLQKELDHFGLLSGSDIILKERKPVHDDGISLEDYRPCNESVGWRPSYPGEEPNF